MRSLGTLIKLTGKTTPIHVFDPEGLPSHLRRLLDITPREYAEMVEQYLAYEPTREIESVIGAGLLFHANPEIDLKKAIAADLFVLAGSLRATMRGITAARASLDPGKITDLVTELRALGTNGGAVRDLISVANRFGFDDLVQAGMQIFESYVVWTEQLDGFLRGIMYSKLVEEQVAGMNGFGIGPDEVHDPPFETIRDKVSIDEIRRNAAKVAAQSHRDGVWNMEQGIKELQAKKGTDALAYFFQAYALFERVGVLSEVFKLPVANRGEEDSITAAALRGKDVVTEMTMKLLHNVKAGQIKGVSGFPISFA